LPLRLKKIFFYLSQTEVPPLPDITLAALTKVHYYPYIEHSNLNSGDADLSLSEQAGYKKKRFLHQYVDTQVLNNSGNRFDFIFQNKKSSIQNNSKHKILFTGNSLSYGFGVNPESRYYNILDRTYSKEKNVEIIPAAISAINSTQENILLHTTILPQKPDMIFMINGWNDVMMPPIFLIRPGDPMTMSALYQKYENKFFNIIIQASKKSSWLSKYLTRLIEYDRTTFLGRLETDQVFRRNLQTSIVNVYISNLNTMIESCLYRDIRVIHFLQPSADYQWITTKSNYSLQTQEQFIQKMSNYPWYKLGLTKFVFETYSLIKLEIKKMPWAYLSYDIHDWFTLEDYLDPVHLNSEGHRKLATNISNLINFNLNRNLTHANQHEKETA